MTFWAPPSQRNQSPPVPGPSPWYLSSPAARVHVGGETWTWIEDPKVSGICHLFSPRDEPVLTVDFYCYVQELPGDRLLIWHEEGRLLPGTLNPRVVFDLLTVTALVPLGDAPAIGAEVRAKKQYVRFEEGHAARYEIATTVGDGVQPITPPPQFAELPEVLVLADFGPAEGSSNYADRAARAIFAFNFQLRQLEVIPQDWFNRGRYDYGYQWITRVGREPNTGRLVGEGIRLGRFRLDPTGRQVEEWLHTDPFYRPIYT